MSGWKRRPRWLRATGPRPRGRTVATDEPGVFRIVLDTPNPPLSKAEWAARRAGRRKHAKASLARMLRGESNAFDPIRAIQRMLGR